MNSMKMKVIEELMQRLSDLQGEGFKKSLDESRMPKKEEGMPAEMEEAMGEGEEKPAGIAIEKVQVMKPKSFDDKADEAIAEMDGDKDEDEDSDMGGKFSDEELAELIAELEAKKKI